MSQNADAFVQLPPDGSNTGKQVRNWKLATLPQPDGTYITAYVQVTGLVDKDGFAADVSGETTNRLLRALIVEVRELRRLHASQIGQFVPAPAADDAVDRIG